MRQFARSASILAPSILLSFFIFVSALVASVSAQELRDVAYTYDELGRLETVRYKGLSADGGDIVYTYSYDPAGNRTTVQVEGNAFSSVLLEDVYALEGDTIQVPVIASAPLRGAVSFNWQITTGSGQVVVADRSGTFSLTAGQALGLQGQIGTIDITTIEDSTKESNEEIVITISDAENLWIDPLDDTSSIFLQDDDVTYFTLENQAAIEGNMLSFTVTKVSPPSAPSETITVTFGTENLEAILATDFEQPDPVTLDFLPADTSLDVTVDALSDAIVELDERFLLKANWTSESLYSGLYGAYGTIEDGPTEPIGEELFTSPGTHNWVAPVGVTSVNAVCVGGGGGVKSSDNRDAGGGGALAWKNSIVVVPEQSYTVVVGAGGQVGQSGGNSSFEGMIAGGGSVGQGSGGANALNASGGNYQGADGGGAGGWGRRHDGGRQGGGGGAGGYTGSGGDGFAENAASEAGSGGGGSGGSGGGGGGVGLYGTGANGASVTGAGGQGGSGGGGGSMTAGQANGGAYGGGAGGNGSSSGSTSKGGNGACRIMWGPGLSFPSAAELSDATSGGGSGPGTSPSTFSVSSGTGDEDTTATLTVSRPAPADREYTVTLTASGTASDPADYEMSPSSLTFTAGQLSQNVTFTLKPDQVYDPNEFITLEAAWSDAENGAQTATGTLTIGDVVVANALPMANTDTANFTLTPTTLQLDENTVACEGSSVFDVLANDTDADGDTLTIKPNSLSIDAGNLQPLSGPSIGTVNGRDGIFLQFSGTGNYVVNYTAQDGKGGESSSSLTVTAGYQPPSGGPSCVQATASGGGSGTTNPVPNIWIEGPTQGAFEGDPLTYTIKMSNSYHRSISIVWKDVGGSAIRTTDYVYPSQLGRTKTISSGQQTTFTVDTVVDADVVDGNKDLILGIESVTVGNVVAPLTASGTILDDDVAGNSSPVLQPDYFTVQMSDPLGNGNYFGQGTFDVLANDSDPDVGDNLTLLNTVQLMPGYAGLGSVSVANGQISATFSQCGRYRFEYEVVDDQNAKSVSFLDVHTDPNGLLSNCPIATAPLPEPAPVVVIGDASTVTEGENLLFPVTLSKTYPDPVRVGWTVTANASDVNAASGILNFNPGDALTKNIVLSTVDDNATEGTETVTVALDAAQQVNAVLGATTSGDGTITDNDTNPTFSVAGPPADVPEGGDLIYTITKTGSSSQSFTVNYTITLGSTTSTNDIGSVAMSGSKTFASGTTTQTVVVPTVDDSDWEQAESVFVNITSVSNGGTIGTATAEGKIGNNDGEPIINIFNKSVFEGDSGTTTATVTIFLQGGTSQPVTVNYRTTDGTATAGSDYVQISSGSVTIQPGDFDATFDLTINGDTSIEGDETVNVEVVSAVNARTVTSGVTASNPTKGSNGVVTIKTDDSYTYNWSYGSWSGYSCTGGSSSTRTRSATCKRNPGNTTVSGSFCGSATTSQTISCSYSASYGSWGSWSTCSSSGSQSRTRSGSCVSNTGHTVSASVCGGLTTSQTQSCPPPVTYSWNTGSWSGYSACTGQSNRVRTRSVTCRSSAGQTVGDGNCSGSKPATSQTGSACSYSWYTGSWTSWSCVGVGSAEERTRSVYCRSSTGNSVSGGLCSGSAPDNFDVRNNPAVCGGGGGF